MGRRALLTIEALEAGNLADISQLRFKTALLQRGFDCYQSPSCSYLDAASNAFT